VDRAPGPAGPVDNASGGGLKGPTVRQDREGPGPKEDP
jgi:hypothetical protein